MAKVLPLYPINNHIVRIYYTLINYQFVFPKKIWCDFDYRIYMLLVRITKGVDDEIQSLLAVQKFVMQVWFSFVKVYNIYNIIIL